MNESSRLEAPPLEKLSLSVLAKTQEIEYCMTQYRLTNRDEFYRDDLRSFIESRYDPLDSFFMVAHKRALDILDLYDSRCSEIFTRFYSHRFEKEI